jgi:glycosyltransferase involved in cell wall biosynthesis
MKVTIITGSNSRKAGGLFNSVRRLSQNLQALPDTDLSIIAHDDEYSQSDVKEWAPLQPLSYKVVGPHAFGFSPDLKKLLKASSPDLVHTQGIWMFLSQISKNWHQKTQKPYLITPRGMLDPWAINNSGWKKKLTGLLYENKHLREASCIHALCQSEVDAIRAFGLENPVCLIPNAIDIPKVSEVSGPTPWSHLIDPDKKILLYLGRIHPKKGLEFLIEAFSQVKTNKPYLLEEWKLVVAGWDQNNHEDYLKDKVKQFGLQQDIFFIGPQYGEKKQLCYAHADAFVLPSLSEGLPMAVLEAWAYQLPVLMTQACNLPEGFESQAALEMEPDTQSITQALLRFFSLSNEAIAQMGSNGRELVENNFTWGKVASQMREVYQWVLEGGNPPKTVNVT